MDLALCVLDKLVTEYNLGLCSSAVVIILALDFQTGLASNSGIAEDNIRLLILLHLLSR